MKSEQTHILLVEDNPGDARLIREMLRQAASDQFVLEHVDRLGTALEKLSNEQFDAILLDLSLPDSTGLDTVVRTHEHAPQVPIVVQTGTDDEEMGIHAVQAGAQEYLVKGKVESDLLIRTIRYAIVRKRAEEAERERQSLQDAVRAMEQVLAVVGHELRTPLAALRATSEFLLTEDAKQTAEWDVFLKIIHDETIRMAEMINNLLEVARLNSGLAQWNWFTVKLTEACDGALMVVRPLIDHGQVELMYEVDPPDLTMNGDPDAIQRLLINLISNSAKHTSKGSIRITAREVTKPDGRWAELQVHDTGRGIPEKVLKNLGQAFVLNSGVVGSDYVKGTGLGLAICKGIAAAHGGSITVVSEPGQGCVFTALLRADLSEPAKVDASINLTQEAA